MLAKKSDSQYLLGIVGGLLHIGLQVDIKNPVRGTVAL